MKTRISYKEWENQQWEKEHSIRPMKIEDVPICIEMTLESFGYGEYSKEEFNTMEQEFYMSFEADWWGRPKYFVCEYRGTIFGMGGYSLSAMDWGCYEFFWLSTRKGYEGYGVASMLVKHRENEVLKECLNKDNYKDDISIIFSCANKVIKYHKRNGYKVLLTKANKKEVIMGKTFKMNEVKPFTILQKLKKCVGFFFFNK